MRGAARATNSAKHPNHAFDCLPLFRLGVTAKRPQADAQIFRKSHRLAHKVDHLVIGAGISGDRPLVGMIKVAATE
jgi:hypothetical protein